MGNSVGRSGVPSGSGSTVEVCSDYDENTINRGTSNRPKPLLKFHSVHGTNVTLLNDGRIARRKDSFCKGLAFSNRPISVDEIICLRLCDVGTNWSGVLRFGVTNVDPASFRDIELPKFACPDLTSKAGYWAKALAERYSIEKSILHFFVNDSGEMYYGINGVNKGLFLNGINVLIPIWIIIDIYGNSVGVEFVDPGDVNVRSSKTLRAKRNTTPPFSSNNPSPRISEEAANTVNDGNAAIMAEMSQSNGSEPTVSRGSLDPSRPSLSMTSSISASNLMANSSGIMASSSSRTSPFSYTSTRLLRFHTVHGVNISLHGDDTIASRKHGEYYLGYVFTERPLKIGEKLAVVILQVEEAFSGSLAFGLTSCDPTQVPASRLPVDSDELLERPEYWVCIKDVGALPVVGDKLCFHIDSSGQVTFSKNDAPSRVIMHVDITVNLWAFFDLYGTTRKIQILDQLAISDLESMRTFRASSEGNAHAAPKTFSFLRSNCPTSSAFNLDSLRVVLPPETSNIAENNHSSSTNELAIGSLVHNNFTISPSSSSSTPIIDPVEISRLRVGNNRPNYRHTLISEFERPSTTPIIIGQSSSDSDASRSPFSDLLSRRRAGALSGSPRDMFMPRDVPTTRTTFADIFETSNASSIPPASITVPVLPTPLFSALVTSVSGAGKSEDQMQTVTSIEEEPYSSETYSECSICMNSRVNAVIYRCGHMCMCFACAKETHRRSGDCPICRTPIIDVIRCYPA